MLEPIIEGLTKILKHIWYAIFEVPLEYWTGFIDKITEYTFDKDGPAEKALLWMELVFAKLRDIFFNVPFDWWRKWLPQFLTIASDWWKVVFKSAALGIGDNLLPFEGLEPEMKKMLDGLLKEGTWGSIMSAYAFFIPWYLQYSANTYGIISKDSLRAAMAQYTPSLPDLGLLVNMYFREPNKRSEVTQYLTWLGYDKQQQDNVLQSIKPIFDLQQLTRLMHREEITQAKFYKGVESMGFTLEEAHQLETLAWFIPPVQDLVRMAVREAFTPEIVTKYGMNEDFPPEFAENALKHGLTEEWSRKYWSSHWELPSLGMGFQMLHRGVITEEDLEVLMRTQDVMPYWRERLTQISYTPYTRVDIRRLYAAGVITESEVFTAYKDIGYDDEKALKMAKFAILSVAPKEKDLTKSELLDAMKKQIITPEECSAALSELGYNEHESKILRLRALYEKKREVSDLKISGIKKFFLTGVYNRDKAMDSLGKLDLKAAYMSNLLELWTIEKAKKLKLLSSSELKNMLINNIITSSVWTEEMLKLGYAPASIAKLRTLHTGDWGQEKEKDLTKGELLSLLKKKLISEKACKRHLVDLGYDDAEASLLVQKALFKLPEAARSVSLANVRKMYKLEIYSREKARTEMEERNLSPASITSLFSMWDSERKVPTQLLSKDDLKSLLKANIITRATFTSEMSKLGYTETATSLLLTLYQGET